MVKILSDNYSFFKPYKVTSDYHDYKISKEKNSLVIHYFVDDSSSSWINDPVIHQKFSQTYKVVSGGWYGDHGRWKTLKRIGREIKCSDIKNFVETDMSGKSNLHIAKPFLSNRIKVTIESEKLPTTTFNCAGLSFTEFYKLMLLDIHSQKYVDCTDLFEGGLTFIGKL